jgi:hypothetical protein
MASPSDHGHGCDWDDNTTFLRSTSHVTPSVIAKCVGTLEHNLDYDEGLGRYRYSCCARNVERGGRHMQWIRGCVDRGHFGVVELMQLRHGWQRHCLATLALHTQVECHRSSAHVDKAHNQRLAVIGYLGRECAGAAIDKIVWLPFPELLAVEAFGTGEAGGCIRGDGDSIRLPRLRDHLPRVERRLT